MSDRLCLSDRVPNRPKADQDPIEFHVWQNINESIKNLLSYLFRGLRLIEIAKINKLKLPRMEEQLNGLFALQNGQDDDQVLELIMKKFNQILFIDLQGTKQPHQMHIDSLKLLIVESFQKFRERDPLSYKREELDQTNTTTRFLNSTSRVQDKSFTMDLNELAGKESKLQFKEALQKPVQQYQLLTKNQINFLYKINKISVKGQVNDTYKTDKIQQLEDVIIIKLNSIYSTCLKLGTRISQLSASNGFQSERKPIPQSTYHFMINKQKSASFHHFNKKSSLTKLIQQKIFDKKIKILVPSKVEVKQEVQLDGTYTRNEMRVKLLHYVHHQQRQYQEQQMISNYLSTEKMAKIQVIQKYFKKYLQNKDQERNKNKTIQQQKLINTKHYLNVSTIKLKSKSMHQPIHQPATSRILKMDSKCLQDFLNRQKEQKIDYKDKIKQSKTNKLFQAVKLNNLHIIQHAGFKYSIEDMNVKNSDQNTALYCSAEKCQYDLCKYLLDNGSNPNVQCNNGRTPTHIAYLSQNQKLIQLFYEQGADLNIQDDNGQVPTELLKAGILKKKAVSFANVSPKYREFLEYKGEVDRRFEK